jgi:rhodanese-related sulfurtransferase
MILLLSPFAQATTNESAVDTKVSGKIVDGFRILTLEETVQPVQFTVYRGDYIKFEFDASVDDPMLAIPALAVKEILPVDLDEAPYFKMKKSGTVEFSLGEAVGSIVVIDYRQEHYLELTSDQAVTFIETAQPLILDVRTPYEFKKGHLKNARLIPVQELSGRLNEISTFKDREILVYCATGNRSTVASKILNDNGFNRISNLRYGIYQWTKKSFPIVR